MTGAEFKAKLNTDYYIETETDFPNDVETDLWNNVAQIYGNDFVSFINNNIIFGNYYHPNCIRYFFKDSVSGEYYDSENSGYFDNYGSEHRNDYMMTPLLWHPISEIINDTVICKYRGYRDRTVSPINGDMSKMLQSGVFLDEPSISLEGYPMHWTGKYSNLTVSPVLGDYYLHLTELESSIGERYVRNPCKWFAPDVGSDTSCIMPMMFVNSEVYTYSIYQTVYGTASTIYFWGGSKTLDGSANLFRNYGGSPAPIAPVPAGSMQFGEFHISANTITYPEKLVNFHYNDVKKLIFKIKRTYMIKRTHMIPTNTQKVGDGKNADVTFYAAKSGGHTTETNGTITCNYPSDREAQTKLGYGGNGGHGGGGGGGCASAYMGAVYDGVDFIDSTCKLIGKRYGYGSGGGKGGKGGNGVILVFY